MLQLAPCMYIEAIVASLYRSTLTKDAQLFASDPRLGGGSHGSPPIEGGAHYDTRGIYSSNLTYPLEHHERTEAQALLHGPLHHSPVGADRHERLASLHALVYPLHLRLLFVVCML